MSRVVRFNRLAAAVASIILGTTVVNADPPADPAESRCESIRAAEPSAFFPRRDPKASFREIGDEGGVVVLPDRSEVKVLNPVAIRIFSLLDGQHSLRAVVDKVTAEFEVDKETALRDARDFLCELASNGMLSAAPHGGPKNEAK